MTRSRHFIVCACSVGALTAILALGGCKNSSSSDAKVKYKIGFSQNTVKEPWRILFNRNIEAEAAKHPEIKLEILDGDDRTEEQVAQMKTFILQKYDAILVSPKEAPGLTRPVEEATAAGIPVIVLDRDVNTDKYAAFVGGDNRQIGQAAGDVAVKLLGGPGQAKGVIYEICGGLASTPAQDRKNGFHDVVDKEPGIKVLGGLDADWKKDRAHAIMQDVLKATPDINLVYAHNDPMAHGAYLAAKQAGMADKLMFIGIDAMPEEGQHWVKTGELTATILYPTPGEKGLQVALDILEGKPVQKRYLLPTRVFTRENIDRGGDPVEATSVTAKPATPPASGPAASAPGEGSVENE